MAVSGLAGMETTLMPAQTKTRPGHKLVFTSRNAVTRVFVCAGIRVVGVSAKPLAAIKQIVRAVRLAPDNGGHERFSCWTNHKSPLNRVALTPFV